jgi:hypothetical protein
MMGERSEEGKRRRTYRSAAQRRAIAKELDHQRNAMKHRGQMPAVDHLRRMLHICAAAAANVTPVFEDGTPREGGNMEEFSQWLTRLHDFATALAPYESPRLANITVRDINSTAVEEDEFSTIYELRARMVKRGIPVDHLEDRRLIIEHELPSGNGHDPSAAV